MLMFVKKLISKLKPRVNTQDFKVLSLKFIYSEKAKIFLQNLHCRFIPCTTGHIWWRFLKILWPSQNIWTLLMTSVMLIWFIWIFARHGSQGLGAQWKILTFYNYFNQSQNSFVILAGLLIDGQFLLRFWNVLVLVLSLVLLLISNLTNELRLHQFLWTCSPPHF